MALLVCSWALPAASGNVDSPAASLCCRQVEVERAKLQRLLQVHAEHIGALRTAQQEVERLQRELQHERAAAHAAASRTLQQSNPDPTDQCAAEQRVCPSIGTIITTSAIALPFSKPLVRTRETLVGNLVATSMLQFMAARWALRSAVLATRACFSAAAVPAVQIRLRWWRLHRSLEQWRAARRTPERAGRRWHAESHYAAWEPGEVCHRQRNNNQGCLRAQRVPS